MALSVPEQAKVSAAERPTALAIDMATKKLKPAPVDTGAGVGLSDGPGGGASSAGAVTNDTIQALIAQNSILIKALAEKSMSNSGGQGSDKPRIGPPPEFGDKHYSKADYVGWRDLMRAWDQAHDTVTDPIKAGLLIPRITSVAMLGHIRARIPAEEWVGKEEQDVNGVVTKLSGFRRIMALFDSLLEKDKCVRQFELFGEFIRTRRGTSKMSDYLALFESRRTVVEAAELKLPDSILNLMLVGQADVTNKTQLGQVLQWLQSETEKLGTGETVDHNKLRGQLKAMGAAYEATPDLLGPAKTREATALASAKIEIANLKKACAQKDQLALWTDKKGQKKGAGKGDSKGKQGPGKGPSGKQGGKASKDDKSGVKCPHCERTGHDIDHCWNKHPDLKPAWLKAKA